MTKNKLIRPIILIVYPKPCYNLLKLFKQRIVLNPETPTPTKHLAILRQPFLDLILDGKKTIESRFLKTQSAPYKTVQEGDLVVIKKSGGLVLGEFTVSKVERFLDLTPEKINKITEKYYKELSVEANPNFWKNKLDTRYAVLIYVANPIRYKKPYPYKKNDMRSWLIYGSKAGLNKQLI